MAGRVGELTAHGRGMDNQPQLLQAVASGQAMTAQVVRCSAIIVLLLLRHNLRASVSKELLVTVRVDCLLCAPDNAAFMCSHLMPHRRAVAIKCITLHHPPPPLSPKEHQQPALLLPFLPRGDPIHLPSIHPTLLLFNLTRSDKLPCPCFLPHACLFPYSIRCCWCRVGRARQPCR